jgi:hypothetical protein
MPSLEKKILQGTYAKRSYQRRQRAVPEESLHLHEAEQLQNNESERSRMKVYVTRISPACRIPPTSSHFQSDRQTGWMCAATRAGLYQSRVASSRRPPPQTANPNLLGGLGPDEKFVRLLDEHPYQIEPTCKGA